MIRIIRDIPVYYEEHGEGKPVLNIHGWPVDHRLMSGCLEPVFRQRQDYRRIYVDLPGMGNTPSAPWIRNSDHMLEVLLEFVDTVIGDTNFLVTGESYGGSLALGLVSKMKERIDGVLLLCASTDPLEDDGLPPKQVIWRSERLAAAEEVPSLREYRGLAVIATPEMYGKWLDDIQPALDIADMEFLSSHCNSDYSPEMREAIRGITFDRPSCIIAGRQDHVVGFSKAYELVERFPRATFAVLDCAGHLLQIENEPLFQQLVKDWLGRLDLDARHKPQASDREP